MLIKSVKLLIVEDSLVLSDRIVEVVQAIPEMDLVSVVESERAAIAALRLGRIDIVILDLQLREGSGRGVLKSMVGLSRKPRVIVLTNHDVAAYQKEAQEWGADYFLDKARDFQRLSLILDEIVLAQSRAQTPTVS